MGKLIILRGNSGSGKSTIAKRLQKKLGHNTMIISQDEIRRNMLHVNDGGDTPAIPLMKELLQYGSEVYSFYFDIPFEETLKHHLTREKSREFGEESMRRWWVEKDFSDRLKETVITADMDIDTIIDKIYKAITLSPQELEKQLI